eukprot:TRINITY_DN5309_c0_g1::TRINITY_DN5309_c0_g1_i1::g.24196::m.24196 TRINITY_DN5309_c0_g1::TRINITY_DN5309_c0_g1_i1::g.24196  ORF type:complete len:291 (-),score=52.28,Solute_trans_a/PF03619.11/5.3e-11 TRINITY_DN5309_c0_g1_i1:174-1046(-)
MTLGLLDSHKEIRIAGWVIAAIVTVFTLFATVRQFQAYNKSPPSQLAALYKRLFFFCPLLAIITLVSLTFVESTLFVHLVINIYEGLVFWWLISFLSKKVGSTDAEINKNLSNEEPKYLALCIPFFIIFYPIRSILFSRTKLNQAWIFGFKLACIQCLVLRPLIAIVDIVHGEETKILTLLKALSIIIAVKSVMGAYYGAMSIFQNLNPLGKFTLIKISLMVTVIIPSVFGNIGKRRFEDDEYLDAQEKSDLIGSFVINLTIPFMVYGFRKHFPALDLDQCYSPAIEQPV